MDSAGHKTHVRKMRAKDFVTGFLESNAEMKLWLHERRRWDGSRPRWPGGLLPGPNRIHIVKRRGDAVKSKATIVDLPDTTIIVCRADEDRKPDIQNAWQKLESSLPTLKGRQFYGLCYSDPTGSVYFAGVVPLHPQEIVSMGFPTLLLKGGRYACVKLKDWQKHEDQIAKLFGELCQEFEKDPAGPAVEYYRSASELHILIPLAETQNRAHGQTL